MVTRGRIANIVAPDTDTPVIEERVGKEFLITRILTTNYNPGVARVRLFDVFVESDGTAHTTIALPVVLDDISLQPNETLDRLDAGVIATAVGQIVARSTVGAADPDDVAVGVFGNWI